VKIVHGYFETGLLLAATVKYLRRETKTVVSFVGFPASVGRAKKILTSLMVSRIDRFIYVSQFTRKSFQLAYPKLLSRPGHIIYNGVIDRANKDPVEVVRDRFQIATVSGLVGWKNVGVLLDAISILSRTTRDIRLVVVGDGPLRKELEQRARTLGISGSVDFVGYREDIYSVLAGSGIYVHPALMEGFGIAVVEAMLLNLPVILADAGALPELVENEVSGLLVDPHAPQAWANAIQRLLEDGDLARRLAEAGRKRAEECFSVARFSGEHEQIYRELLNDS
jgi:glycosyltransferase involved in cell wall biosynthesis